MNSTSVLPAAMDLPLPRGVALVLELADERVRSSSEPADDLWESEGIRDESLADIAPRPVDWLWEGRIAFGTLTVLQGDPAVGKSLITLCIAARATTGAPMPDEDRRREPTTVLMYAEEDPPAEVIRPRLDAAGADVSRVRLVTGYRDESGNEVAPMFSPDGLRRLELLIRKRDARVVIVDPLASYMPDSVDSYRDQHVRQVLRPLASMAARTGSAVVLVRHLTKDSKVRNRRGLGSIGITAAARIELTAQQRDGVYELVASKSNMGPYPRPLTYCIVTADGAGLVAWSTAPADADVPAEARSYRKHQRATARAELAKSRDTDALKLADTVPIVSARVLHDALGVSIATAGRVLRELRDAGLLDGDSRGSRITDAGRAWLLGVDP